MAAHWKRLLFGETPSSGTTLFDRFAAACALSLLPPTLLIIGVALTASVASGQSFPRTLNDIRLFGRGESIQITFSQEYDGMPSEEHAPGRFALTFVGVGSQKPVRDLKPRDESIFKEIKVVQNRYSTTVTFLLRDPKLSLKDRVSYKAGRDGLNIELALDGTAAAAAAPLTVRPASESLLSELEQKIGGMPAQKSTAQTADPAPVVAQPAVKAPSSAQAPAAKPVSAQLLAQSPVGQTPALPRRSRWVECPMATSLRAWLR
jgi:hypothetical protein